MFRHFQRRMVGEVTDSDVVAERVGVERLVNDKN
jgi:hypothetical protein